MKTNTTHRPASALRAALLGALCLAGAFAARAGSPPVITGVTAAQRTGTKLVDIAYSISDPDSAAVNIAIFVSKESGATWTVPAISFTGTGAPGNTIAVTATPAAKTVVWNAGADWDGHFTTNCRVRVLANDNGLAGIPGGSYLRGNVADINMYDAPQYAVTVSAFTMDSKLVTGGQWNLVKEGYAQANGYDLVSAVQLNPTGGLPSFKALSHPVQTVSWFDAVKWCNARSQMEGLTRMALS